MRDEEGKRTPHVIAICYHMCMSVLYVRDVPDEVSAELKERASSLGLSLSAYVAGELTKIAARPTNADIVRRLAALDRSGGPSCEEIVDIVRAGRGQ